MTVHKYSLVSDKIKSILKAISQESETLQLLKTNPEKLMEKFGLNKEEVEVLKKSDMLFVRKPHLGTMTALRAVTYTFETGSTIIIKPP